MCRDGVVTAILDILSNQIAWPDHEERKEIAERIEAKHKLPNCSIVADGTLLLLAFKPETEDHADHSCQKKSHALSMLVINDDFRRVRRMNTGWARQAHNTKKSDTRSSCITWN